MEKRTISQHMRSWNDFAYSSYKDCYMTGSLSEYSAVALIMNQSARSTFFGLLSLQPKVTLVMYLSASHDNSGNYTMANLKRQDKV
jgi:hypothetical protein